MSIRSSVCVCGFFFTNSGSPTMPDGRAFLLSNRMLNRIIKKTERMANRKHKLLL